MEQWINQKQTTRPLNLSLFTLYISQLETELSVPSRFFLAARLNSLSPTRLSILLYDYHGTRNRNQHRIA
jgi:hypothetical protein